MKLDGHVYHNGTHGKLSQTSLFGLGQPSWVNCKTSTSKYMEIKYPVMQEHNKNLFLFLSHILLNCIV